MQVAGSIEHSQKSFAEIMAEQLEEQQNMFVDGGGAVDTQATISSLSVSNRHVGVKDSTATVGYDLLAADDIIMSNGIKAMMKRQRAYRHMLESHSAAIVR
ncbi:hypothetical protein [Halodesulfovibrio aestuarii]|uniref:hypothetical protein n=1 Tax=Halodesulfovibrio aestuarii TaxID=126333 RepID=UPI000429AEB5